MIHELLTEAFCPMRSIGRRQHSASAPDSGLSSPTPSRSDHFSAILPVSCVNSNNNDNKHISRTPSHMKHAQLRGTVAERLVRARHPVLS